MADYFGKGESYGFRVDLARHTVTLVVEDKKGKIVETAHARIFPLDASSLPIWRNDPDPWELVWHVYSWKHPEISQTLHGLMVESTN